MPELAILADLVVIFAAGLVVVGALRRVHVPAVAGFILTGTLLGPSGLGLIAEPHRVELLAEVGIVLLLFGIGLELSIDELRRVWRTVFVAGLLQISVTLLAVGLVARMLGYTWSVSLFVGCMIALSSTAVVLRSLGQRGETDSPHGRVTFGVLLLQDLAVVPMILAVPLFAAPGERFLQRSEVVLLTALVVILGAVVAARYVVPSLLRYAARSRSRELFVQAVLLICLGAAYIVARAGLSLAIGAFVAGLVVGSSEFRHQVAADIIPPREALASVFFVSIGMLFDPALVVHDAPAVLGWLSLMIIGKLAIAYASVRAARVSPRTAWLSAAALAQVGEFSFVLYRSAVPFDFLPPELGSSLLAAVVLSMMLTPAIMAGAEPLVSLMRKRRSKDRAAGAIPQGVPPLDEEEGVETIVVGYGLLGASVAQALRVLGRTYLVVDANPANVHRAQLAGHDARYGDVTSYELLASLGAGRAQHLLVAINDRKASERCIRSAHEHWPELRIVVRVPYADDVARFRAAGASEVLAAEAAATAAVTEHLLAVLDVTESERTMALDAAVLTTGRA